MSVVGIAILLTWQRRVPGFLHRRCATPPSTSCRSRPTTGFVTQDYARWPVFAPIWMLFLSCILCSTGSIGGGIKMFRTLVLSRQALRELRLLVHPSAVAPLRVGGKPVPDRVAASILAFIFLYFMTVAALTFALLLSGLDFDSAFGAIVACINNAGPGLGVVGPVQDLSEPDRLADLDLHVRDAPRTPRDLQRAGALYADVLAQVAARERKDPGRQ